MGKLNEAVDAYRVALGVAANGTGRGRVLLGMGLAYEAKSDNSAAERYYREVGILR